MPTLTNVIDEANRLMDEAQREHLRLRLIGGLAVRMHSSSLDYFNPQRIYPDIDFVVDRRQLRLLASFFRNMGYMPDTSFNTLNGGKRQIYYDTQIGRHIDIFVGDRGGLRHVLPGGPLRASDRGMGDDRADPARR